MDKVSVIIPVYNAGKYLKKCISSISRQTYSELEIIAVEDCGTDNSLELLNEYAAADPRIIVVRHEINKGPEQARISGLERCGGKFVMFVDSDDWLSAEAIEAMVRVADKENADMVTGAMVRVMDRFGLIKSAPRNNYTAKMLTGCIARPELFDEYFISFFGVNQLFVSACSKLYRREVLDIADLPKYGFRMGEDLMFSMSIHPKLNKIAFIEDPVYFYRYGGVTSKSNPTFLKDIKRQYRIKEEYIRSYDYAQAIPFIKYELINCFYSYVQGLLIKDKYPKQKLAEFITGELEDDIYQEATSGIELTERSTAIKDKDVEGIIRILERTESKDRLKYRAKRIISSLLN